MYKSKVDHVQKQTTNDYSNERDVYDVATMKYRRDRLLIRALETVRFDPYLEGVGRIACFRLHDKLGKSEIMTFMQLLPAVQSEP